MVRGSGVLGEFFPLYCAGRASQIGASYFDVIVNNTK